MKNREIEKIFNMFDKIPKNLSLDLKKKILRNKLSISLEHSFIQDMKQVCAEDELKVFLNEESKILNIDFINIEELPDNINEFDQEFLDGIFLITN